jgi:predicted O-methyltransferase YrrM
MYSLKRIVQALIWLVFGDQAKKRRVKQECARIAANLFGDYPLSEDCKLWREDTEFLDKYRELSPGNPYSQDRKYILREMVRYTEAIPGDIAECGCFEGASAYFMALERQNIEIHLFDSFEGLSEVSEKDITTKNSVRNWKQGDLKTTEEKLKANLKEFDNIVVHKGWIPEKFPDVAEKSFCFVHIDVDLFEPTLASLQFFYPKISAGGVLLLDDFGFTTCPGAYDAAMEYMESLNQKIIHLTTGQGLVVKNT